MRIYEPEWERHLEDSHTFAGANNLERRHLSGMPHSSQGETKENPDVDQTKKRPQL